MLPLDKFAIWRISTVNITNILLLSLTSPSPPIQPQTLLKLHAPGIPQHHAYALFTLIMQNVKIDIYTNI